MNQELIDKTIEKAKEFFKDDSSGHDFWHTLRVYNNAKNICMFEECDEEIVCLAALLHDFDDFKLTNSTEELENATKWLMENDYPLDKIKLVKDAISTVSYKGKDTKVPNTIEGKIVQDADRLDAIGAMGIARCFAYGGKKGREIWNPDEEYNENMTEEEYKNNEGSSIAHFHEKLLLLKDLMNTTKGKEIAKGRHKFLEEFLKEFYAEWNGKK